MMEERTKQGPVSSAMQCLGLRLEIAITIEYIPVLAGTQWADLEHPALVLILAETCGDDSCANVPLRHYRCSRPTEETIKNGVVFCGCAEDHCRIATSANAPKMYENDKRVLPWRSLARPHVPKFTRAGVWARHQ